MTTKNKQSITSKKTRDCISNKKISWIDTIPKYLSKKEINNLSQEEKKKLLNSYTRPKIPLPDLPPLARIRLFKQEIEGVEAICQFDPFRKDPRALPEITNLWSVVNFTHNKSREWEELGGLKRPEKPFFIDLWAHLDTLDLIQSECFALWETASRLIQKTIHKIKEASNTGEEKFNKRGRNS
jgi:hypothetical protein